MLKAAKVKRFSNAKSSVARTEFERVVIVAERERRPGLHAIFAQDADLCRVLSNFGMLGALALSFMLARVIEFEAHDVPEAAGVDHQLHHFAIRGACRVKPGSPN